MTDTLSMRLRGQADNVEGDGWVNAARHMREAADELEQRDTAYGVLRVALRNAGFRVAGSPDHIADVSTLFRRIEAGKIDTYDATTWLQQWLSLVATERSTGRVR